jgi:putative endonuclease
MKRSWAYILKCSDNSYYTGCTSNLEQRVLEHVYGKFEGYTSSRLPVRLEFSKEFSDINDAMRAERQIKNWSRAKKQALIRGDLDLLHALATCKNGTHSISVKNDRSRLRST